jgi:hypothetical protein
LQVPGAVVVEDAAVPSVTGREAISMTRIIIEDVESIEDLLNALSVVTRVFTNPALFDTEQQVLFKGEPDQDPVRHTETEAFAELGLVKPYIPCPYRGEHLRLTECWMCWSVHRGAAVEFDVLAPAAWDIAIGELLARSSSQVEEYGE